MLTEISLIPKNQTFNITLSVDNQNLTLGFYIYWNNIAQYWLMDVTDTRINQKVLSGIPLLETNGINLLEQFAYLGIGSATLLNVSNTQDAPNQSNLGTDYILLWGDTPA